MRVVLLIGGAALVVTGFVFLMMSLHESFELQSEINARLPEDKKFEPLFWSSVQYFELRRLQKLLLPESRRYRRFMIFGCAGPVFLLLGIALLARSY